MIVAPTLNEIMKSIQGLGQEQFGSDFNVNENSDFWRFYFATGSLTKELYDRLQVALDNLELRTADDPYFYGQASNFLFYRKLPTAAITYQMQATNPVIGATADIGQIKVRKENTDIIYENTQPITVTEVPFLFSAKCTQDGEIGNAEIGEVNEILSTPDNWGDTFTNIAEFAGGQDLEELEESRRRYFNQEAQTTLWNEDGIYADIIQLSGVNSVNVVQNRSDIEVDGIPRRAIHVVVDGGVDSEIIQSLYRKVLPATYTLGAVRQDIITLSGDTVNLGFDRPTDILTDYEIEIYPAGTIPQTFKDAVEEYGDTVGVGGVASGCAAVDYIKENVSEASNYQHIGVLFKKDIDPTYTQFVAYGSNEKPVMQEGV